MWIRKQPHNDPDSPGSQYRVAPDDGSARAEETEAALRSGRLPGRVRDRMQESVQGKLPWTSDLSVNEWHLLQRYGFQPRGLVMGSSYYHVGYNAASQSRRSGMGMGGLGGAGMGMGGMGGMGMVMSGSVTDVEQAIYEGRRLALQRMSMEAQALGAHAVVGVRMQWKQPDYAGHESEFAAFGTAVTLDGEPVPKEPVLCTVDGVSLVKLLRSGALPIGLAMGVSVYYQASTRQDMWQVRSWSNQEIQSYTAAVYQTRNSAVRSMRQEASAMGAAGVLAHETRMTVQDIEVERGQGDSRTDHVVEFLSMGTAIASTPVPAKFTPKMALNLVDGMGRRK